MTSLVNGRTAAIEHCRQALALMDEAGDTTAAAKLQGALDTMLDLPAPRSLAEVDAILGSPEGLRLQRQLGWIDDEPAHAPGHCG